MPRSVVRWPSGATTSCPASWGSRILTSSPHAHRGLGVDELVGRPLGVSRQIAVGAGRPRSHPDDLRVGADTGQPSARRDRRDGPPGHSRLRDHGPAGQTRHGAPPGHHRRRAHARARNAGMPDGTVHGWNGRGSWGRCSRWRRSGLSRRTSATALLALPMGAFLPMAIRDLRRHGYSAPLACAAAIFLVVQAVPKKRPHYLLPMYPFLALALAMTIVRHAADSKRVRRGACLAIAVAPPSFPSISGSSPDGWSMPKIRTCASLEKSWLYRSRLH